MEWKTVKLGDIGDIITGKTPSTKNSAFYKNGDILFIGPSDLNQCVKHIYKTEKNITNEGRKSLGKNVIPRGAVCVSCIGTIGYVGIASSDCATNQQINSIVTNESVDADFIYYLMRHMWSYFKSLEGQSTTLSILNKSQFSNIELSVPSLAEQKRIAAIFSSLDAKIENNNRINANLEAQAQAFYKSWFIDFEPWGGVMPEDWKEGKLTDIAELFDSKRIPLSGMQRSKMEKIYPYYGATSIMDYVDNYIFDGIYLLMGEDGSVVTEDGFPYLQYVEGKFWCNNHAHIMQGRNGYSTEMLYCLLKQTKVAGIVTGAVQGKISQASMQKIQCVIPPQNICERMTKCMDVFFEQIRMINKESQRLAQVRDTLLPKLMKGEIEL